MHITDYFQFIFSMLPPDFSNQPTNFKSGLVQIEIFAIENFKSGLVQIEKNTIANYKSGLV